LQIKLALLICGRIESGGKFRAKQAEKFPARLLRQHCLTQNYDILQQLLGLVQRQRRTHYKSNKNKMKKLRDLFSSASSRIVFGRLSVLPHTLLVTETNGRGRRKKAEKKVIKSDIKV
jgi:hypothetical protein